MDFVQVDPTSVIGSWRKFGEVGETYQVIGAGGVDGIGTPEAKNFH